MHGDHLSSAIDAHVVARRARPERARPRSGEARCSEPCRCLRATRWTMQARHKMDVRAASEYLMLNGPPFVSVTRKKWPATFCTE